jgi:2-keto-4-pentenoate hydratase/2-oxohepta-3-ene-1,7-dioic acid hydratase in catechol pathway
VAEGRGLAQFHPKIAAVLHRTVDDSRPETPAVVFGYTLVGDWLARRTNSGRYPPRCPALDRPCVVTADGSTPRPRSSRSGSTVKVGEGEPERDGAGAAPRRRRASKRGGWNGETFASGPFEIPGFEQRVWPGAEVELEAEGIGVLRNRLGR